MSIDRSTGLFGWDESDVSDLARRAARLNVPVADRPRYSRREAPPTGAANWCEECRDGNHAHRAVRVGPYLICRCLHCTTVVIEGEPYA